MEQSLKGRLPNWDRVQVHVTAEINVTGELVIGDGSIIGPGVVIEGTRVVIGREAWLDRGAYIGGGSAFDPGAFLVAGDWLHMGRSSHINTARGVTVGHEFGCGIETKVFTHGAYESELDGFPVKFAPVVIGDRVWLPNAWVNPGVTIGSDVVVAARSLVNRDLPSGCLAGGIPAQVLREGCYPKTLTGGERSDVLAFIAEEAEAIWRGVEMWDIPRGVRLLWGVEGSKILTVDDATLYMISGSVTEVLAEADRRGINVHAPATTAVVFDVAARTIDGPVTEFGRVLKNQLRRHGIRFRYEEREGRWQPWA